MIDFILLIFGLICGSLSATLGLGAGTFMIIFLTLFTNIPIKTAISLSLISVISSSFIGTIFYFRRKMINLKLAISLETTAWIGAIIGAFFALIIPSKFIEFILAIILFYVAIIMIFFKPHELDNKNYKPINLKIGLFFSFIAGIVSSVAGIGGGIIKVPVMNILMKVPIKISAATSNFMIGLTALASIIVYSIEGVVNFQFSIPIILGTIFGALIGTHILIKGHPNIIKCIIGIVILIFSMILLLKNIFL
ncbi:MAG: sulfite exporter TauE/SafE family protein [Candidatus Methanomethyliaceae archaeon]